MTINDYLERVNEISPDKDYWFVRTDSGLHFDTYYENNFIGIGWNYIYPNDINNKTVIELKQIIADNEGLDLEISKSKSKATGIYNKIIRFKELKKGDLVIIPSNSSSRLAFGIIDDDRMYVDIDQSHDCEYQKRRKVKWLTVRNIKSLDPMFYQIKVSRHTISRINEDYHSFIDNVTDSLYSKNGYTHFVVDINTTDDINVKSLISFIDSFQTLSKEINSHFSFDENIEESSIKLNLQSPGLVEFKLLVGKTLVALAMVLSVASCDNPQANPNNTPEVQTFLNAHQGTLSIIDENMIELKIDIEKINSIN